MLHKALELFKYVFSLRERDFVLTVNHEAAISALTHDARLTFRYIFMTAISVSLATMGIILDDITVVVGAMLIAPMMNPIVLLGFAICRVNYTEFVNSIRSIITGILLAISLSYLIVKISPIHEITPAILSRTQPNIYNLLVALFSGAAGTYTKIKRNGGEIVGVALAASLVPPLCVVGFSIAVGHYQLAQEAGFLFLTNLIAIALSGTLLARWYGFGFRVSHLSFMWQVSAYIIAITIMSVPLILSLKEVVYEISMNRIISEKIRKSFSVNEDLHLIQTHFSHASDKLINIKAIVFTDQYKQTAQKDILDFLRSEADRPIDLTIEQVLYLGQEDHVAENLSLKSSKQNIISMLRETIPFQIKFMNVSQKSMSIEIFAAPTPHEDLNLMHKTEMSLRNKLPEWTIKIVPPTSILPTIYFGNNQTAFSEVTSSKLELILWMLERWKIKEVTVTGFTNDQNYKHGDTKSLALERVNTISSQLNKHGIHTISNIEYKEHPSIIYNEMDYGIKNENKVIIRLHNTDSFEAAE